MWINYQFMAVCPLILIFLHISSQKWIVFANHFGLPNFLPQLPNFFYMDISVISVIFSNSVSHPHNVYFPPTYSIMFPCLQSAPSDRSRAVSGGNIWGKCTFSAFLSSSKTEEVFIMKGITKKYYSSKSPGFVF